MPELPTSQSSPESRPTPVSSAGDSGMHEGPETHLTDYVKVLYKRRWTAFTAFALVAGAITVYTFTATPIYEARTRLLLEAEQQHVVNFKQVVDEDQTKADYYQTQYNVLQSRALARRTLDGLRLWNTPPFGGTSDQGSSLKSAILGGPAALAGLFKGENGSDAAKGTPAVDETAAQSSAIDAFASQLTVSPIRNSRLVDVKYRHPDPALATSIVNALARNYIEQNLEYRFMASKEANDWLGARLAEQRKEVEAAEARLQQLPGAERDHRARGPRQHHRAEARGSERGGHARENRPADQGGDVPAAPGVGVGSGQARHGAADPDQPVHPAAEG